MCFCFDLCACEIKICAWNTPQNQVLFQFTLCCCVFFLCCQQSSCLFIFTCVTSSPCWAAAGLWSSHPHMFSSENQKLCEKAQQCLMLSWMFGCPEAWKHATGCSWTRPPSAGLICFHMQRLSPHTLMKSLCVISEWHQLSGLRRSSPSLLLMLLMLATTKPSLKLHWGKPIEFQPQAWRPARCVWLTAPSHLWSRVSETSDFKCWREARWLSDVLQVCSVNLQHLLFHRKSPLRRQSLSAVLTQMFSPPSDEFAIIDGFI